MVRTSKIHIALVQGTSELERKFLALCNLKVISARAEKQEIIWLPDSPETCDHNKISARLAGLKFQPRLKFPM